MYLWWSLCTLYLHACQMRVTIGDSGLCCCTCIMYFECWLTPLCVDSAWWASCFFQILFLFFQTDTEKDVAERGSNNHGMRMILMLVTEIRTNERPKRMLILIRHLQNVSKCLVKTPFSSNEQIRLYSNKVWLEWNLIYLAFSWQRSSGGECKHMSDTYEMAVM